MELKLKILEILEKNAKISAEKIATMLSCSITEVQKIITDAEMNKEILGYKTVINWESTEKETVNAIIELKVMPQRGAGFDKIAERIYQYPEVKSLYLMSGGFDLAVMIEGNSMKEVAMFVAEKLSPMEYVVSTATHFVLKPYKIDGVIFNQDDGDERRVISL